MSEEEKKWNKRDKPTYIMVPRLLVRTWIASTVMLVIGIVASFQYTNYVSRQLCGLISISDDSYKAHPPPSETGKALAREIARITDKYNCK